MMNKKTMLGTIIGCCFFLLYILIVVSKCLTMFKLFPVYIAAIGTCLVIGCFILFKKTALINHIKDHLRLFEYISYKKLFITIALVSLITKILAVFVFQINSIDNHPDIHTYVVTSSELAELGYAKSFANYCYSYSHMFWYAVFLFPITKLFGISQTAYSVYLSLIMTGSTLLLFDVVAKNYSKGKAFLALFIYTILPSQILLPQFVTHEIGALLFLCIGLWVYFRAYSNTNNRCLRCIFVLLLAISVLFCSLLNAMGYIVFIAFSVVFLMESIKSKKYLCFLGKVLTLLGVIILGTIIFDSIQANLSMISDGFIKGNKVLWTLYVGSNYSSDGSWYNDTAWNSYPDYYDAAMVNNYHKELLSNRYVELFSNPLNVINLIKAKLINIWGDFSYSIGLANETISDPKMQEIYNSYLYKPLWLINYCVLLLISIFGLATLHFLNKSRENLLSGFFQLFLLGETAMLLITECNNKYTIAMVLIFIIVSIISCDLEENYTGKIKR